MAPDTWYAPCVSVAVQDGIARGVSPTVFDSNADVTREQMALFLSKALQLTQTK